MERERNRGREGGDREGERDRGIERGVIIMLLIPIVNTRTPSNINP